MRNLFLFLFITVLGNLSAQDCNLRVTGQVLDRTTKEPMEYTTIAIEEGNRSVIADSMGYFNIEGLCKGKFHLMVFHLGCPPERFYLTIKRDTNLVFYLEHHTQLLREVTVEGKYHAFIESQNRQSISSTMIKDQSGKSLAEMVDQVIGVRTLRTGSGIGKPIIHGMYGNRIALVNNGLLQAGQQWGADHAPEIDPNSANVITVIKGSNAIEYGVQALGGALLVEAGPINIDPHLHGTVGYAFESNGLGHTFATKLQSSSGKIDWRIAGSAGKSGDHRTPDYFLTNTGASEINSSLQIVYRPSEQAQHQLYYSLFSTRVGIFAGAHISNLTDLEEAIGRETPFRINDQFSYSISAPKQHVAHHLWKYSGKKFVHENVFIDWAYGIQYNHRQEFDIRRGDRSDIPALDLKLLAHTANFRITNDARRIKYRIGAQVDWKDNSNNYDTGILPLIPDYQQANIGVFAIGQLPVGLFVFEGGLRTDYKSIKAWTITTTIPRAILIRQHVYQDFAVSAGVQYKPGSAIEMRWHNTFARRSPEPNELYSNGLHQGIAGIEEGVPDLNFESSLKSIFTQSVSIPELLHFEVSLYAHYIPQYIYLKPQDELRLTIRGAFPVYRYTQEDSWIRGMDVVMVSDFSHHLEVTSKLSLIKGTVLKEDRPLAFIPPSYFSTTLAWIFPDSKGLKGGRIELKGEFTGKQKNWDAASELLSPPEAYFLFGLNMSTGIKAASHLFHVGISMDNLLNKKYRNYLNRLRYFSDEEGRMLNVILRYEF